jgi:flagellar protein FlbD
VPRPSHPAIAMIELTRLGSRSEPLWLNPDLVATIEAHPDTVIALTTGSKVMVVEDVSTVVERVRAWRVSIAEGAVASRALTPDPMTLHA